MKYLTDGKRHLVCLPYSIDNLHRMADDLLIGRHWFHAKPYPHYDIPQRRKSEIENKCEMVSPKVIVKICKGQHI